ncbi:MAG TPA: pentapeptide repeat-containing protein [Acidimicrobiales bacterium]|nr:pentapeptide repeat-containing protein [Acidimicrobiales bacterium]
MLAQTGTEWVTGVTTAIGFLGAVIGLMKYVNYKSKRDRIADVGAAFESVTGSLSSDNEVRRLAAAIRLRRFFDPGSELGVAGATYAMETLGVIAGILREQPTGNFQKLLADGLKGAPSLVGADLQRTNLQGAYLSGVDVSQADFYRADLSGASFKDAVGRRAVFYQARMVGTVFTRADLREANFFEGDLSRAQLAGARLAGAIFTGSRGLPSEVLSQLDQEGRFAGPDVPLAVPTAPRAKKPSVFVSRPSVLTAVQEATWRLAEDALGSSGADVVRLGRTEYPPTSVLADVRRVMSRCGGVVILGLRQVEIAKGRWRPGTPEERSADGLALATPWNHVEGGMAAALGLPVLVVKEPGVEGGIFDLAGDVLIVTADLDDMMSREHAQTMMRRWVSELPT